MPAGVYVCTFNRKKMARHILCVLDRTVGWDYVSIFINKNSNYNKINQICAVHLLYRREESSGYIGLAFAMLLPRVERFSALMPSEEIYTS